jgi:hypothetical protein
MIYSIDFVYSQYRIYEINITPSCVSNAAQPKVSMDLQLILPVLVYPIVVLCEYFKVKVTVYCPAAITTPGWLRQHTAVASRGGFRGRSARRRVGKKASSIGSTNNPEFRS